MFTILFLLFGAKLYNFAIEFNNCAIDSACMGSVMFGCFLCGIILMPALDFGIIMLVHSKTKHWKI